MKLKFIFIILLSIFILLNSFSKDNTDKTPLDEIPMYGGEKITEEQKKINEQYIVDILDVYGTREKALDYTLNKAWEFFYNGDITSSIKKFNQAWLLDSGNTGIYWGFGLIYTEQNKMQESIQMLETAAEFDIYNYEILVDLASSYTKYALIEDLDKKNKNKYLLKSIKCYEKANQITSDYGPLYNNWAVTLTALEKYQEALEKINYAESIGFQTDPNFVKDLKNKLKK